MIEIRQAEELICKHQFQSVPKSVPVFQSCGLRLAEDVRASDPLPRYTNSAMDGLAVHAPLAENLDIRIIGESSAGAPFQGSVGAQQGVRISTGAMIPDGANAVIPVEQLCQEGDVTYVTKSPQIGQHIREKGEEVKEGDLLLQAGIIITPPILGLLLSIGRDEIVVAKNPVISILTTGNEVKSPESELEQYQVRNTNQSVLVGMLKCMHLIPEHVEHVGDSLDQTSHMLKEMASSSDVIVTTGGVSMGYHDLVREAAQRSGFEEVFWKVSQKPGKPMLFGKSDKSVLFGLPGNPVSALICALHYVWPYIHRFGGRSDWDRNVNAVAELPIHNKGDRHRFVLVKLERTEKGWATRQVNLQRSHMMTGPVHACGYTLLRPEQQVAGGERIMVTRFPWRCQHGNR